MYHLCKTLVRRNGMDEYYCTKCGSILNWQYGFDPDESVWTCTECGQLLTDGSGYEGERFKDIAWFCDSCGAYLNRQAGFSDLCETWVCAECGYTNSISEDNIFDSSTVSRIRENNEITEEVEETFFCPNCGVRLNDQDLFDRYEDDYECAECGASLHHDYPSEEYDIEESAPLQDSGYSARTCNSEVQKVKDSPNTQIAIKKRPVYNAFAYICGTLSGIAFYKVLLYEAFSSAFSGTLLAILSLMFFVLSITPKFDKYVRISRYRIRKSFFVFLCMVGVCKLPSISVAFFEWLFSF